MKAPSYIKVPLLLITAPLHRCSKNCFLTRGVSVPASQRRLHYQLHFFFQSFILSSFKPILSFGNMLHA